MPAPNQPTRISAASASTSASASASADGGVAPAAQKAAQKKAVEAAAQAKDVRRNGLLCFSDMIISPPTYTARMFSRRKHTNITVKVEYMSDEEDKFVDEVYFRKN